MEFTATGEHSAVREAKLQKGLKDMPMQGPFKAPEAQSSSSQSKYFNSGRVIPDLAYRSPR